MNAPDPQDPRQLFERAAARVDQGMAFRLRRARGQALQGRPARRPRGNLLPVGAVAAAVLALGLAWWLPGSPGQAPGTGDALAQADVEALVQAEDAELYAWLAEGRVARSQP